MLNTTNMETVCAGCFTQLESNGVCPVCGYDPALRVASPHHLRPRTILGGKYLLGKVLGQGGFGITYIGWDLTLNLTVAIKEYYPSGFVTRETTATNTVQPSTGSKGDFFHKGRERFLNEAMSVAKFVSLPGIVSAKEYIQENGTAYIVTEFIHGRTLKAYLEEMGGRLPSAQVFGMMEPVMASLAEVHAAGIIHRDISPDNIMITYRGQMKLIDFGAAREFADSGHKSMSVLLKPGYAPEEQYRTKGIQGPWTDIYALCATMYRAMAGVPPLESTARLQTDGLQKPSALGVTISPSQEAALMKGMAAWQKDRYQSISDLYTAIYGRRMPPTAAGRTSESLPHTPQYPPIEPRVIKKSVSTGAVILIAAVVLTVLFFLAGGDLSDMMEEYPFIVLACIGGGVALIWHHKKRGKPKTDVPISAAAPVPGQTPAAATVSVLCTRGYFAGVSFPVVKNLAMGRDPSRCHVVFPEGSGGISSLHCEVSIWSAGVVLTDKGSTYGTFLLSGRKLNANESVTLASGDGFYLADRQNEFLVR